jgi:peptide/nickel transport system substrate-binding protein
VLEKWHGYWEENAEFDQISIQFVSVLEELVALLQRQMLDVVAGISKDYVATHAPEPPWRLVAMPAIATTYLGINVRHAPLDDVRVREAIHALIDRERLVSELYPMGTAIPATSLVAPEVFGFSPDHRSHDPDPERARRLLAEAGVEPGTKVRLDYQDRYAFMIPALVELLAEAELEVEPRRHAYETYYRRIEEAENELFLFSWNFQIADAAPFLEAIVHSRDLRGSWGNFNGTAVSDPNLDLLIEQAAHETRSEMRLEMLQRLLAEVETIHVYLPLSQPAVLTLAREPFDVVGRKLRPQDVRLNP